MTHEGSSTDLTGRIIPPGDQSKPDTEPDTKPDTKPDGLFDRARRVLAKVASTPHGKRPAPGTVVFTFGRYFAPKADLLTREGFKTIPPLDGVSPFSAAGEPDPDLLPYATCERSNDRVKADVHKDLATRLAASGADYLLVDNSAAALWHCERNGRYYTVHNGEATDLTDELIMTGEDKTSGGGKFRPTKDLDDRLRAANEAFVAACLAVFPPERIILVRSRCARIFVDEDGKVGPTDLDRDVADLLDELDRSFEQQTGCRVVDLAMVWNPSKTSWLATDHAARIALEQQVVDLVHSDRDPSLNGHAGLPQPEAPQLRDRSAADHVLTAKRAGRPIDADWLRRYFTTGPVTRDDLLALVWLHQDAPEQHAAVIRDCAASVLSNDQQPLVICARNKFRRSLEALRGCPWRKIDLPELDPWTPQIVVSCGRRHFRFHTDGSLETFTTEAIDDASALVSEEIPLTPANLTAALHSWPWFIERGRRGVTAAPRVVVADAEALVDSCHWFDWSWALDNENLTITTPEARASRVPGPRTRSDLSFMFDRRSRIFGVAGGLMDQVTHIALHDQLCTEHGLRYYIDDFRYTWWRSHNGFEASRLAPALESRRMTKLVSQPLIDSFRCEVMTSRLPWLFAQAQAWHSFGLHEAVVVTKHHPEVLRMLQSTPDFPVLVYRNDDDLERFVRDAPSPVSFYTTLQRIPVTDTSVPAVSQVFNYRHLTEARLDRDVAEVATQLRARPHVALHVRRGDYLTVHHDAGGWHSGQEHYVAAIDHVIAEEFGTTDIDVAVFSDDLTFVSDHRAEYGLDKVTGTVRFIGGNQHYRAIMDSYLMSLCPVIVGSVGGFAATTSLLAPAPSTYIRTTPGRLVVAWRR